MAGLISRKPVVGIASGILFGMLGVLLLGLPSSGRLASLLYVLSGTFFLFVAAVSVVTAAVQLLRRNPPAR